jgi:DNA-3-methyladenine glycosylase
MDQSFYSMPTLDLAKALIGKSLIHQSSEGTTSGLIVETEAYIGPHDKASHSYGWHRTPRVEPMYGPPAHA